MANKKIPLQYHYLFSICTVHIYFTIQDLGLCRYLHSIDTQTQNMKREKIATKKKDFGPLNKNLYILTKRSFFRQSIQFGQFSQFHQISPVFDPVCTVHISDYVFSDTKSCKTINFCARTRFAGFLHFVCLPEHLTDNWHISPGLWRTQTVPGKRQPAWDWVLSGLFSAKSNLFYTIYPSLHYIL